MGKKTEREGPANVSLLLDSICDSIRILLRDVACVNIEQFGRKNIRLSDLEIKSIVFIEIQVALEEKYKVELDALEILRLDDLSSVSQYICNLASASSQ